MQIQMFMLCSELGGTRDHRLNIKMDDRTAPQKLSRLDRHLLAGRNTTRVRRDKCNNNWCPLSPRCPAKLECSTMCHISITDDLRQLKCHLNQNEFFPTENWSQVFVLGGFWPVEKGLYSYFAFVLSVFVLVFWKRTNMYIDETDEAAQ